ncbi:MAG: hypothetical protein OXI43_18770 [Candidatus Poribacteria bacterium]|nr:hypothetical protein [Candidatus Poribacteria bacterium]
MNKYEGDNFEDFLKEEGILEEVTERARKRLLVWQLGDIVRVLIRRKTTFDKKVNSESMKNIQDVQNRNSLYSKSENMFTFPDRRGFLTYQDE